MALLANLYQQTFFTFQLNTGLYKSIDVEIIEKQYIISPGIRNITVLILKYKYQKYKPNVYYIHKLSLLGDPGSNI